MPRAQACAGPAIQGIGLHDMRGLLRGNYDGRPQGAGLLLRASVHRLGTVNAGCGFAVVNLRRC
jgi:hypothetical protein